MIDAEEFPEAARRGPCNRLCGMCPVWVAHQLTANTVDQDTSGFLADSRTLPQMEASGSSNPEASLAVWQAFRSSTQRQTLMHCSSSSVDFGSLSNVNSKRSAKKPERVMPENAREHDDPQQRARSGRSRRRSIRSILAGLGVILCLGATGTSVVPDTSPGTSASSQSAVHSHRPPHRLDGPLLAYLNEDSSAQGDTDPGQDTSDPRRRPSTRPRWRRPWPPNNHQSRRSIQEHPNDSRTP